MYQQISAHAHARQAGPSRDRKRKEISGKLGREMNDRREEYSLSHHNESISINNLRSLSYQLCAIPEACDQYQLRLFPCTLERSALLSQIEHEENHALDCAQITYDEERERVEDEYKKGWEKVRERLLEGIEERRRRARDDKEGEGTTADATIDSQSRTHLTRKLRNKLGTSPPATPPPSTATLPVTSGPFLNPYSLSVDEIPSPFPLPLTATSVSTGASASSGANNGSTSSGGRRKPKGNNPQNQAPGGLGKSLFLLVGCKEQDLETDLGDIRGRKRRRVAVGR